MAQAELTGQLSAGLVVQLRKHLAAPRSILGRHQIERGLALEPLRRPPDDPPHRGVLVEDDAPLVHDRDRLAGVLDQRPEESAHALGDLERRPLLGHVDQHAVHQQLAAVGIGQEQRPFVDPAHSAVRQDDAVLVALRLLPAALEEPAVRGDDAVTVVGVDPFHPPVVAARPFLLGEADDRLDVRADPDRRAVGAIDIERGRQRLQKLRPWRSGPRRPRCCGRPLRGAVAISAHRFAFPLRPIVPRIGRRAKRRPEPRRREQHPARSRMQGRVPRSTVEGCGLGRTARPLRGCGPTRRGRGASFPRAWCVAAGRGRRWVGRSSAPGWSRRRPA